ncbi:MAG: hypothetical protein V1904_03600 [Bacteroidota bacterium]
MKKYFIIALTLALPAVFFSCNESKYRAELKTIDSLNIVLDSIHNKLGEIDTILIKKEYKEYLGNIELLKKYFNDKKEDSTWKIMTSYGAVKSSLKQFISDYPGFYSEISFSRTQLDSLKKDIKSGDLEKEKIKEYTKTESEFVSKLETLVNLSVGRAKLKLELLDSLNPEVTEVIGKLKKEWKFDKDSNPTEIEDD